MQDTNLILQGSPLPATFVGTPNDFLVEMLRRLKIVSPSGTSFIFTGDVEPASNVGPWLKNGTSWFVFDQNVKRYVPLDITASETLWYQIGSTLPATTTPPLWLKTTENATVDRPTFGTPIGFYLFDGVSWVGFTEVVDKEISLSKMDDGIRGTLITYNADNRPVLLAIGAANQFLHVNALGTDLEWSALPATALKGLLSAQLNGPLTDSGGYSANTQAITFSLSEDREVFITVYADVGIPNGAFSICTLEADGVERDSVRFEGGDSVNAQVTLIIRTALSAGNHTLTCAIPAPGFFIDPVNNNARLPVKFMVQLL
jgi:hypothetical protein